MFGMHECEFEDAKAKVHQMFRSGYDNTREEVYC